MESEKNTKTIVILGMHRSGTSLTAGILAHLGVDMGAKGSPALSNVKGHFEDTDFLALNRKILSENNASWNNPPDPSHKTKISSSLQNEARELILKKESRLWGWKDPRTVFTLEYYLPYLTNPYFIFVHRDAQDVAESLHKRNGTPISENILLTEKYHKKIKDLKERTSDFPQLFLEMRTLTMSPESELKSITDFLGINLTNEDYKKISEFVLSPGVKKRKQLFLKCRLSIVAFIVRLMPVWFKQFTKRLFRK